MEELLRVAMGTARTPQPRDRVYKDECMFSFDTPESPGGLYTSLTTWQSFGADYVDLDYERNGNPLYLKQVSKRIVLKEEAGEAEKRPEKIAIGVEGGFDVGKKRYESFCHNSLVVFPQRAEVSLPSDEVPTAITMAVEAILKHDGFMKSSQIAAAWEEEDRKVSKYADSLVQLDSTGRKISPDPKKWRCEDSGMTENLWLNLSTGHIGSGRRFWDGSGGTGASLKHYVDTGSKYPLAVKLGTITPQGADVYSYAPDEDDMVLDPRLAEHLAHWGINMMVQEKTEKSMTELTLEKNATHEFDKITESGSELVALHGAGYIGLENLGNSCYMASVMQIIMSMPEMTARYKDMAPSIFKTSPEDPSEDLMAMTAKLAVGLQSARYAKPVPLYEKGPNGPKDLRLSSVRLNEEYGAVRPFAFQRAIGKGHPEFGSSRQQDASEFFQYFLDKITNAERRGRKRLISDGDEASFVPTEALFSFKVEERIEDIQSRKCKYMTRSENMLSLAIDLDAAENKEAYQEFEEQRKKRLKVGDAGKEESVPVQLQVPLSACLKKYAESELIEGFTSPETGEKGNALKRTRLQTFPEYLVVHLKKYYIAEDWTPKKLDAAVLMPEELDLSELKGTGPNSDEVLFENDAPHAAAETPTAPTSVVADPGIVQQLMTMGFSENGSKRAAVATQNSGAEAGVAWAVAHMEDADFNEPVSSSTARASEATNTVEPAFSQEHIGTLGAMGFTEPQAKAALKATEGSLERAADWLFSHAGDLEAAIAEVEQEPAEAASGDGDTPGNADICIDGEPKYEILGFASHLGSNTSCGHYVAHIKKEARFVLYNDVKVAVSQNPPMDAGFLYIYRRK